MEGTDGREPTFPNGYAACSGCHRLILVAHTNMDGLCGGCEQEKNTEAAAIKHEPVQVLDPSPEDLMRDTIPAMSETKKGKR